MTLTRNLRPVTAVGLIVLTVMTTASAADTNRLNDASAYSAFGRGCESMIKKEVAAARSEIKVAIYCMTRRNIAECLIDAAKRGVKIGVRYDAKQADEIHDMAKLMKQMTEAGIACQAIRLKGENAIMHHKFIVIDRARVITGSYNFTNTATEQNRENLVAIESTDLAELYLAEYERLKPRR